MSRRVMGGPATAFIAGELRAQKARQRLLLDEVAARAKLGRSTVDRALSGDNSLPVETLLALCDALEMDAGLLLVAAQHARRD